MDKDWTNQPTQHALMKCEPVASEEHKKRATRVRACIYVNIETGQNFLPVLKIVTSTMQATQNVNVAKCACDQCSIFSTVQ